MIYYVQLGIFSLSPELLQFVIYHVIKGMVEFKRNDTAHGNMKASNIVFYNAESLVCKLTDYEITDSTHDPHELWLRTRGDLL